LALNFRRYDDGIVVTAYTDHATGEMSMNADGSGQFTHVRLAPSVTISSGDPALAKELHHKVGHCVLLRGQSTFRSSITRQ